jgi:phage FluMu protein Com
MAKCPHCERPLSTYTETVDDGENPNIKVLVCAQCDKLLGVVGQG